MSLLKHLTEFGGMTPYDSFKSAIAFLKKNKDCSLHIPLGRYIFSGDASKLMQSAVMRGNTANTDRFNRGLSLIGVDDANIEGNGAQLVSDGFVQLIYLKDCSNITISNLKIDHLRKPFSIGRVSSCLDNGNGITELLINFSEEFALNLNTPVKEIFINNNGNTRRIKKIDFSIIDNFSAKLYVKSNEDWLGAKICVIHCSGLLPTIKLENCRNITFKNIKVLSSAGAALSAENCDSLVLSGLEIVPPLEDMQPSNYPILTNCTNITEREK